LNQTNKSRHTANKSKARKDLEISLGNGTIYTQYNRITDRRTNINEEYRLPWLPRSEMGAETRSEIRAARDQALRAKYSWLVKNTLHLGYGT
jgi:hypothetical protein